MDDTILSGDHHVHSTFSDDGSSTLAENIRAASLAELRTLRLVDHVRESTTWVPEFLAAVAAEPVPDGLTVLSGVEAKIMDSTGRLDLPASYRGNVLIADHQFPGIDGPWSPTETRERLGDGLATEDALDLLIAGLVGAMESREGSQLAHCFSILPKVDLNEDDLSNEQLARWASAAASTGAVVEINEKWACPGPRALRAAVDAGASLVASTDSHVASDIGRYRVVPELLLALEAVDS